MISTESIIFFIGNMGAAVYLIRSMVKKIESNSDLLPKITSNLEANTKTQSVISESIKELYDSRNNIERRLVRVETIQENVGCSSGGRRAYDPVRRVVGNETAVKRDGHVEADEPYLGRRQNDNL